MPVIETDPKLPPSIVPADTPDVCGMSDDECLARLATIVQRQDLEHLDEMTSLIARLAVAIE